MIKTIKNSLAKYRQVLVAYAAAIILLLTPLYGLGYVIILILTVRYIPHSQTFRSQFSRLILSILLLVSSVMIAGLIAWVLHIETHPLVVALLYIIFISIFKKPTGAKLSQRSAIFDKGDFVSITLALIAPLVIAVSFFTPNLSLASVYQLMTNGWDNGSHLLMLETAEIEKGYIYGPDTEVLPKTINHLGAYPQAWHLASANIANGFSGSLFNPNKPLTALVAYVSVLFVWYFLAVYIFSRTAWGLVESKLGAKLSQRSSILIILLFSMANLLVQVYSLWGSLTVGFANYIGCIALLAATAAVTIDSSKENSASYPLSLLLGTATALCWFLPLPAIILMISAAHWNGKKSIKQILKPSWSINYVLTIVAAIVVLFQVGIFIIFSEISGIEQLNNGHLSGAFLGGEILLFVTASISLTYWLRSSSGIYRFNNKAVAIIGSTLVLAGALYTYQLITSGEVSYYFGKIMRLSLVIVGIFFVSAFTLIFYKLVSNRKLSNTVVLMLSASIIGLIIMASNQSILGLTKLFQMNSLIEHSTATKIIDYLETENLDKTKLVILRHQSNIEDYNSKVHAKVAHLPYTCTYYVVTSSNSSNLEEKIKKLNDCAAVLDKKIIVITSDKTKKAVESLGRDNIKIINVP